MKVDLNTLITTIANSLNDGGMVCNLNKASASSILTDDLSFDSIAMVEMQMGLEDFYQIELPCPDLNVCVTVRDVFELVKKKLEKSK